MNLENFIKETLVQITKGVTNANLEITGAEKLKGTIPFIMQRGAGENSNTGIHFDVAISAKSEGKGKAGGKFRLFVVDADLEAGGGMSKESISRVKFSVAVDKRIGYNLDK